MAPTTRSSVHGRQPSKAQNLPHMDIDEEENGHKLSEDDDAFDLVEPVKRSPFRSAKDMLLPLQETADRVSRQVEEFAKAVDKFKTDRSSSDQDLWTEAFELLQKYAQITETRKTQTKSRAQPDKEQIRIQVDNLQLESNLWTLTETLLKCKCPASVLEARGSAETGLMKLHRYSTNWEIWNTFLDSDTVAQEYECVLDWLQESAAQQAPPLEEVVAESTKKSDRGDGIWSSGHIYTKDAIKKQKRARAWPMPLDPTDPGLRATHMREDAKLLVTQMDPDASTRQDAHLMQADDFHEDAAWEICWEMLRRGMRLDEIRAWWADRRETWRTAILEGSNRQAIDSLDSPWLRIFNIASNPQWLQRCQVMSEKGSIISTYESAVYGILSGNHQISVQACDDIEDIFFSYYNAVLIKRFEDYLAAYHRKIQDSKEIVYYPAGSSFSNLRDFLSSADSNEFLKEELQNPHRFVESALISQDFDRFFLQQGRAAAQIAHLTLDSAHLIENDATSPHDECAQYAAQDQDSVRIVAHLQLLLRGLGFLSKAYKLHPYLMDNNIVNYIGFLEREAKFGLLPLYASKLSPERAAHVLGTILIKVVDAREQELQVKLMKQYDIDVPVILFGIFQLANYTELQNLKTIKDASLTRPITTYTSSNSVKQIKVRPSFMGGDLIPESYEERAVRSAQWTKYMDTSNWEMATIVVTSIYKIFLLTGKLSAAKQLAEHVRLSSTSLAALGMNLNLAVITDDASINGDVDMDTSIGSIEDRVQPLSPSKRRKDSRSSMHVLSKPTSSREDLAALSRNWAQLEQLVEAMEALESWQDLANEIEETRGDHRQMRHFKKALQDALNILQTAMTPLLDFEYLTLPSDDDENLHLQIIRNHYIPEMILGYNSALYFAGHSLSRTYLTQCMNLAQEVAQNDMLTNAFVESGRMRELVNAFALDSQALLRANEIGSKPSATKKGKRESVAVEGNSDIWQIDWKDSSKQLARADY